MGHPFFLSRGPNAASKQLLFREVEGWLCAGGHRLRTIHTQSSSSPAEAGLSRLEISPKQPLAALKHKMKYLSIVNRQVTFK